MQERASLLTCMQALRCSPNFCRRYAGPSFEDRASLSGCIHDFQAKLVSANQSIEIADDSLMDRIPFGMSHGSITSGVQ